MSYHYTNEDADSIVAAAWSAMRESTKKAMLEKKPNDNDGQMRFTKT